MNLILKFGIPAGLWQAAILWTHPFWLPNLFLMGTFFQNPRNPFYAFWYLDVLAANLMVLALIAQASFYLFRGRKAPSFGADLALVLFGVAAAILQVTTGWWDGHVGVDSVSPFKWFWMLAIGVLITQAVTRQQKAIVCCLLAVIAAAAYMGPSAIQHIFVATDAFFFGSALLLVWARNVPVPRFLHRPLVVVASSTLFIYITHISVIKRLAPLHLPVSGVWELVASLAVGILTTLVWNAAVSGMTQLWRRLRGGKREALKLEPRTLSALLTD